MPREKKVKGLLEYWRVPVVMQIIESLHATAAPPEEILQRMAPSEAQLTKREDAGEEITPIEELAQEMDKEGVVGRAVFRMHEGKPHIPAHWLKGHLKEAGANLSRVLNFWGLHDFVGTTMYVAPQRCFIEGLQTGTDRWGTYFDIPKIGRRSGFRIADYVTDPCLKWSLFLVADPRWSEELLQELLTYGSMHGFGGTRGLDMGKYLFEVGKWRRFDRETGLRLYQAEYWGPEGLARFAKGRE